MCDDTLTRSHLSILRAFVLSAFALLVCTRTAFAQTPYEAAMARGESAFAEARSRDALAAFEEALAAAPDSVSSARATNGRARALWRLDEPSLHRANEGSRNRFRPSREPIRLLLGVIAQTQDRAREQMAEPGLGADEAAYAEALAWLNLIRADARALGWPEPLRPSEFPRVAFIDHHPEDEVPLCDNILSLDPIPRFPPQDARALRTSTIVLLVETTADNNVERIEIAARAATRPAFLDALEQVVAQWRPRAIEPGDMCGRAGVQFVQLTFTARGGGGLAYAPIGRFAGIAGDGRTR